MSPFHWFRRGRQSICETSRKTPAKRRRFDNSRKLALTGFERLEDRTLLALNFLQTELGVGDAPTAIAVGDFNNDSALDIAVTNSSDNNVSVLLGNGDGTFRTSASVPVGQSPSAILANDFNGDGRTDLVVANAESNNISVLRGRGDGTFSSATSFVTIGSPISIAAGDFNLDDNLDLAVAIGAGENRPVSVFLGNGNGAFQLSQDLAVAGPSSVAVSDVNEDGAADVIATDPLFEQEPCLNCIYDLSDNVIVRLGNGDGTFLGETDSGFGLVGTNAQFVSVGDFNYDGRADLAVGDYHDFNGLPYGIINILLGERDDSKSNGINFRLSPTLSVNTPTSMVVTDFNNRHNYDLALTDASDNSVKIFLSHGRLNNDAGFEEAQSFPVGQGPVAIAAADFNGDQVNDLVVVNKLSNTVSVLIRSHLTFSGTPGGLPPLYFSSTVWGDYDNDGDLDVLLAGRNASPELGDPAVTQIYRNEGDGTFSDIHAGLPVVSGGSAAWGDYDNDGDLDILLTGVDHLGSGYISRVYRNEGDGTFVDIQAGLPGLSSSAVAWGDFDNDGDLDILLTGQDRVAIDPPISRVYENQGDGTFVDIHAGLVGVRDGAAAWGDYDNDGDLDILLTGGLVSRVYENLGGGTFVDIHADLSGVTFSAAAWGDYDNDGNLDILLAGRAEGGARISRVYQNQGGGTFSDISAGLLGVSSSAVAWGDYDNDGDLDVLLTGYAEDGYQVSRVYKNEGGGAFVDITAVLSGVANSSVGWGDYDNDGDLDILLSGGDIYGVDATSQIWRNDSETANTAPAAPTQLSATSAGPTSVTLSWTAPRDAQTRGAGLSYSLRVGTTPGGSDIIAAMALGSTSGTRTVATRGLVQGTSWTLNGLAQASDIIGASRQSTRRLLALPSLWNRNSSTKRTASPQAWRTRRPTMATATAMASPTVNRRTSRH